jgi:hypothetical protein
MTSCWLHPYSIPMKNSHFSPSYHHKFPNHYVITMLYTMLYHLSSSLCTICTAWLKYGFNQLMDPLIIRNILDGIIPYK